MQHLTGLGEDDNSSLRASYRQKFLSLAGGALFFSIAFSLLQERVFRIEGFHYGGWLSFLTYLVLAIIGFIEWATVERCQRNGKVRDFAFIALLATAGYYFTNWSLLFLEYATRIVFKSSKILPVMLFGSCIQNKQFTMAEYTSGGLLVLGVALFTLGNKDASASFDWAGVMLITIALCCDALTANLEERRFFRGASPCQQGEVVCLLSAFAAGYSLLAICLTGEVHAAVAHSMLHREVVPLTCMASLLGYAAVTCVLALIRYYGAVAAEVVKSMRKVLQVLASLVLFPRPMNWKYVAGTLCMICALTGFQALRQGVSGLIRPHGWLASLSATQVYRPFERGRGSIELEDIPEIDEDSVSLSP